jgi:2OG-Fe(II) oxygenase superfamily
MNLFPYEPTLNLLPFDGIANYYGPILASCEAQDYLEALLTTVPWRNDEAVICGKRIVTARKVAWYGDSSYSYTYSGTTKIALPWTKELRTLKSLVEEKVGCLFNSCLCNLYHDGSEGMGWHSDDEKALGQNTAIGSLSLPRHNFSTNSWIVRFLSSTISSFSKRCHASRSSLGSYFWDCRITPRMCFSSTASSASSTEPLRFVSNMNFSACSLVSKNQQQSFLFSANLAGTQTR